MDKSMAKGLVIGGIAMVVLGAGAVGGYKTIAAPRQAEVLAVKDVTATVLTPQERCDDVAVKHQAPVQDEHRVAGSVIGGLAGGHDGAPLPHGQREVAEGRRLRRHLPPGRQGKCGPHHLQAWRDAAGEERASGADRHLDRGTLLTRPGR